MAYALLEEGASYAEWQKACAAINKINFTIEDAEEGFDLIRRERIDQVALDTFLARFQDVAPEMVIASLGARFNLVAEAEDLDVNLKVGDHAAYQAMLTGPLRPEDFWVFGDAEA